MVWLSPCNRSSTRARLLPMSKPPRAHQEAAQAAHQVDEARFVRAGRRREQLLLEARCFRVGHLAARRGIQRRERRARAGHAASKDSAGTSSRASWTACGATIRTLAVPMASAAALYRYLQTLPAAPRSGPDPRQREVELAKMTF
jgi:hypothetical protein